MQQETPEFLIDDILPSGEAHLIGGASGSGKTTWIFQNFLAKLINGEPILDHESHSVPYVYISMDRSRSSVTRTLIRLRLIEQITRVICLEEMPEDCLTLPAILKFALSKYPDAKLVVIEGFALIAGEKTSGYTAVGHLMRKTARICSNQGLTIIGVCHAPKMRTDEAFQHSRELLLGSVAWAAYSDTIIVLNMDEPSGIISVKVMPRNAAMETHEMRFGASGALEMTFKGSKRDYLVGRIARLPLGRPITRTEILQWATSFKIGTRTADEAVKINVENGVLLPLDAGIYERSAAISPVLAPENDITVD